MKKYYPCQSILTIESANLCLTDTGTRKGVTGRGTIKELREEKSRAILMEDKGMASVVFDKQDYLNKD